EKATPEQTRQNSVRRWGRHPGSRDAARRADPYGSGSVAIMSTAGSSPSVTIATPAAGAAGPDQNRPGDGCARRARVLLDEADQTVVVALAPVDHARPARLLVQEQIEVVPDELHLEERIIDRHRLSKVLLAAHDPPRLVRGLVALRHDGALGHGLRDGPGPFSAFGGRHAGVGEQSGGRRGHGDRSLTPIVDTAAVGGAAQPGLQFADRGVQRAVEVRRARLGADHRTFGVAGDFDALAAVRLRRVGLVEQPDVDPEQLLVVPLDFAQLLPDVYAVVLGYLDVSTLDDDVHG